MLKWEDYNTAETVQEIASKHGATIAPAFFEGSSEADNKTKAGGTADFDLVMADGFWPRLDFRDGLIQSSDNAKLSSLFADFRLGGDDLTNGADGGDLSAGIRPELGLQPVHLA